MSVLDRTDFLCGKPTKFESDKCMLSKLKKGWSKCACTLQATLAVQIGDKDSQLLLVIPERKREELLLAVFDV